MADTIDYGEKEKGKSEGDKDILEDARKYLKECIDEESNERAKMLDDLRFCTLDQWPVDIRKERENDLENGPRPCLTIDKINQYIVQVVNDMRQGKPGINVRPQDDQADVETAKILKGLIRNIEDQSNADIAYSTAGESAAKIGLGYFRITTEYVDEDSFDQEIFIRPIPNTFSVYLGHHIMPDGSDAERGYIVESVPLAKFKNEFPEAKATRDQFDELQDQITYWHTGEMVTVVEEFCIKRTVERLYYLDDGTTMTKADYDKWPGEAGPRPIYTDERSNIRKQLKWRKMTGIEVLEKRDLPGKYIPIVEVIGRESHIEGKRVLWGLVRPAKDSLRMDNYIASTIVERMGLAPKVPFIGAKGQFEGMEDKWRKANRVNYAYLEYNAIDVNGNAIPRPERQGAMPMEIAMVNYRGMIREDVRNSLGMFKASVGDTESQQSGRAILALQRESDTGTYHFGANLGVSIRHAGKIILDMIPYYYDTKRIVRIIGEDGTVQTAQIDPSQDVSHRQFQGPNGLQNIYNPGVGKYDVAITVGPSYNTKRMEAAATLTEVVKSQPQMMPLIGDLLFRSLDFPYSDQIAERLRKMLPPQLQQGADPAAMLAQVTQKMQLLGQQMQEMSKENQQLKAGAQVDMAKVQADAAAQAEKAALAKAEVEAELALQKQKQDGELQLARDKAVAEIEIKRLVAEADHNVEIQRLEFEKQNRVEDTQHKTLDVVPQVVEMITGQFTKALEGITQNLDQQSSLNREILQTLAKPKTISLGGIKHASDGSITGASATVN